MRKTVVYLVILAILAFGVYYFIFNNNDNPFGSSEAGFTIKDTGSVGRIFLAANDGESVLVERTDSGWMVNKTYRALPSTLNDLMTTLYKQSALYPVTQSAYDNVIKALSTDGTKVEIYDRKGKKMSVFYVGGTAVNDLGTNMLMDGATKPYVVHVQGFNGYLTPRYSSKLKDWRDRTVFNIPDNEIKSISVQYPGKPGSSFTLVRENGGFAVKSDTPIVNNKEALNMRRVNAYLKYFTDIHCEGYLNGVREMDTTIKTAPKQSTIEVEGMHGQHQRIDIYWMAINQRSKNRVSSNSEVPDDYDADRLYAVINNNKDTVMIQQFVFGRIFRKTYEFFEKDVAQPANYNPNEVPRNVIMKK